MRESERQLGHFARTRSGIFTRADAARLGVSAEIVTGRLRSGEWVTVFGEGLRAATTPLTIAGRERAAVARFAHPGALSHLSAARRWGLLAPSSPVVWITVPARRRIAGAAGVRIYRSRHLTDGAVRWVDGLPVLAAARTVADLALHLDVRQLTAVALTAMQRNLCSLEDIRRWQLLLAGRPGSAELARALDEADPAFESILSAEFARLLEIGGEVLLPKYRLSLADGSQAICDFADPVAKIAFEVDGVAFHSSVEQVARDKARDRKLLAIGWVTVRYGTDDVRSRPAATIADVRRQREVRLAPRRPA